jgi:hypothetical protein
MHGRNNVAVIWNSKRNQGQKHACHQRKQNIYPVKNKGLFIPYDEKIDKVKNPKGNDGLEYVV